jgi:hypothetical protein
MAFPRLSEIELNPEFPIGFLASGLYASPHLDTTICQGLAWCPEVSIGWVLHLSAYFHAEDLLFALRCQAQRSSDEKSDFTH